jgi:hypothetical protein
MWGQPPRCWPTSSRRTLPVPCRLNEAYEAAVAAQGGLHAARPKELLEALQPDFPELTVQVGRRGRALNQQG